MLKCLNKQWLYFSDDLKFMKEYLKQIDALRCYAVFGVMFGHLYPSDFPVIDIVKKFYSYLPGVQLFFCISGFLITSILIKNSIRLSKAKLFKSFYARRFLRIFPIYYTILFLLFLFNFENYRQWFLYDFLYVTNIKQGMDGTFGPSVAPHFWSLAVEEQFYIFWPFLLTIKRNKKHFLFMSILICAVGIMSRLISTDTFFVDRTFGALSFLGSGAILAVLWDDYRLKLIQNVKYLDIVILIFILFVLLQTIFVLEKSTINYLVTVIIIPVITLKFAIGFESKYIKMIVENRFILYLGKISYGLYIFHLLALFPALAIKKIFSIELLDNTFNMFLLKVIITIICAAVSWEFFEKRINSYKERFKYI